jgi:uncharacterized caspase-like protein
MRRALLVGIDDYPTAPLAGCVNDAERMAAILAAHEDGSPNFDCRVLTAPPEGVTRRVLRHAVEALFREPADVALLYFSGHGTVNNLGGYLVTVDAEQYDEGMSMTDVLKLAQGSKAAEVVIILDCCHSGAFGATPAIDNDSAVLREGMSVLAASRATQASMEVDGAGVFTTLVADALEGGATDICGNVTVAAVYAYVDQALGAWDQRPMLKAHVSRFTPLRRTAAEADPAVLRLLPRYFSDPHEELPLDPGYEPDVEPHDDDKEQAFGHLQTYRDARLLKPVGEKHLYYAAVNSKACALTALGRHYWYLANSGRL